MSETSTYTPARVWEWANQEGGRFTNINRPISGATHEKELPVGEHPLQLHSLATPNGVKVTVMLEELVELGITDAEYDAYLINIMEGDQFSSGFVAANPNSKIPALIDNSATPPIRIFESGAILVYLAEKFNLLLPTEPAAVLGTLPDHDVFGSVRRIRGERGCSPRPRPAVHPARRP